MLLSIKNENIYDLVFKSMKRILTLNNIYQLNIKTITIDDGIALINGIKSNFHNTQRIECWFHLKQNLVYNARLFCLLNKKIKI